MAGQPTNGGGGGGGGGAYDPLTGGGAYTTGGEGATESQFQLGGHFSADPFTGGGAYNTSSGDTAPVPMEVVEEAAHFPQSECLTFPKSPNVAGLEKKLLEFNGQVGEEDRLKEQDIERLKNMCNKGTGVLTYRSSVVV